jgi:micrococcal nuclease
VRRRLLAALFLVGLSGLLVHAWTGGGPPPRRGVVTEVIDGDTILVRAGGRTLDVRLLGIDTPETVHPRRPVECFGPQASRYAKRLLSGAEVRLTYDRELRDRYGRWLAYVYAERDRGRPVFVNARLVAEGYARTLSIAPNTLHADELAALERRAALAGRGLWSACG